MAAHRHIDELAGQRRDHRGGGGRRRLRRGPGRAGGREPAKLAAAALGLAAAHGVEMPITEQMAAILEHGKSPQDAIRELMARPGRDE